MYERLKRDGDWLLVFRHDSTGGVYFTSNAEARSVGTDPDIEAKFSALNGLEEFRREDGKFQFKLHYPELGVTNIWKQSNNFAASSVGQFLTNGNLAGGQFVTEQTQQTGTWSIIEKSNPGSSNYVVEQSNAQINSDQLRYSIPQTRLLPNRTYTLSCWVGYENESDHDTSALFHSRWYDSSGTPYSLSDIPGDVFEAAGNEVTIDGIVWKRHYARFTTPSTLSTSNMLWYFGYSSNTSTLPTGKRWATNFMLSDVPLIKNYTGDYDAYIGGVRGYEAISIQSTASSWGGLEFNTGPQSLADGSVDSSSWWYAIGQQKAYTRNTTPGQTVNITELWIYAPVGSMIGEYELATRHLREFSNNNFRLVAKGVANGSSNLASCYLNDVSVFTPEARATSQIRIIIFNDNMTVKTNSKYLLNNSTQRSNFINALNNLTNEIFLIISNGSMYADAAVDTAINQYRPVEYRGASYFANYPYSYAAFGRADLGIVYDRCIHLAEGDSIVDTAFEDKDGIGSAGYGKALLARDIVPVDQRQNIADFGIVEGQNLIYKVRACIDRTTAIGNGTKSCNLRFYNAINAEVGRQNAIFGSSELFETQEYFVPVPAGAVTFGVWSDLDQEYFDYALLFKGGFSTPDGVPHLISNINGMAAQDVINSPISGNAVDDTSWLNAYNSDSNLYDGITMPLRESDNVHWGNYVLTNDEKCFTRSTGTQSMIEMSEVDIDPTRPYFLSMWVNSIDKDAGYLHFSCRVKTGGGSFSTLTLADGTDASTYPVIDRVDNFPAANGKWILLQAFILPHTWTDAQHQAFRDKYQNYFGVYNPEDDPSMITAKGVGSYTTNAISFYRWKSDHATMFLRYRDEGSATESQTMWALPIVSEVKVACFYENTLTAIDYSMK